jgi:beta-phosphoglucomutase
MNATHINTNIRAFLFDMDGVLFDSMPAHATSWQKAFESVGIKYEPYDVYLNEGRTGTSTITEVFEKHLNRTPSQIESDELYRLKTNYFESMPAALPVKGMKNIVEQLHKKGYELWIVTGSSQKSLLQKIEQSYGKVFGKNVINGDDVLNGKPNPEPYLKALERAKLTSNQAIVIENAPLGVISAKEARIFTVAINTGILTTEVLTEAGADLVFSETADLKRWLEIEF